MNLYDQIGGDFIERAITEFYRRAFADGIIGHFFFGKNQEHITRLQIDFATAALGGPRRYQGRSLVQAHSGLIIKRPHFGRRQVIMDEVLTDLGLSDDLRLEWLKMEEGLRALILRATH